MHRIKEAGIEQLVVFPAKAKCVTFTARELQLILDVYARKVAQGEWRDYAISFDVDRAVFAIFRRSRETPLFCIQKNPQLAQKQGQYSVVASGGYTLKRGQDLKRVMMALDKPVLVN